MTTKPCRAPSHHSSSAPRRACRTNDGPARRSRALWLAVATLIAAGPLASSTLRAAAHSPQQRRPNIVLIMADDMGFECLGANGGETYRTPNLDRLAAEGMRFENCYSQPLCTPSRVQIMTGRYNSRNYIRFGLLDPQATTFGNLLKLAGYATCVTGKWQLLGGFDGPGHFGFDEYCLWQLTRRPNRYANPGLEINGKERDFRNGEYGPDITSQYAIDFIQRHAHSTRPFFLYYPMILPHWPFEPTPDSPDWDPMFRRQDEKEKNYHRRDPKYFVQMVAYVDKIVGRIAETLRQEKIADRTLLVFTGDNGTFAGVESQFRGRTWIGGKGHMMDNGTHVSLIGHWPGTIPAGRVNKNLVDFSDFLPTLLAAAGTAPPADLQLDGRSFLDQLQGRPGNPRQWVYCWYFRNGKPATEPKQHTAGESARSLNYKLYRDGNLYYLPRDFYETRPVADAPEHPERRTARDQLEKVIAAHTRPGFYDARPEKPQQKRNKNKQQQKKKKK